MQKVVSLHSLRFCFLNYLVAFFLGRFASRMFAKALHALGYGPSEGATLTNVMIYYYAGVFVSLVIMGLVTVWLFLHLKRLEFSTPLFVAVAAIYSVTGVAGVAGMLNALYPPQAVLMIIPIQFLIGLILVVRHTEKHGTNFKPEKEWKPPNSWK